jgi:uncharacterized repeat protein (TIGR01451 family)
VTFSNAGTATANAVVVTDTVPAGFYQNDQFTATSSVGTVAVSGRQITVTAGNMAPNAQGTLTISGTVRASSAAAGNYTNTASATTSSTQSSTTNDSASCQVTVLAPSLALSKASTVTPVTLNIQNSVSATAAEISETASAQKADSPVIASQLVYTITVTNNGTAPATNVNVVDTLPAGVKVVANPNGGTVNGSTVTWNIASLAAGASTTRSLTVQTISQ